MGLAFDFLQTACFIIVLSYVLTRTNVLNDDKATAWTSRYKLAVISLIFLFISLYGVVIRAHLVSGVYVDTRIAGIAMAGMIFGYAPAALVLIPTVTISIFIGDVTVAADVVAMFIAFALSGYCHKHFPRLDAVLSGIIVGILEIAHMLLIVWLVRPMSAAKTIIYSISFPMIVINGLAVLLFVLVMKDLNDRKRLWNKEKRIQSEMAVARNIQMSLLSKDFEIDPRLDLHAYLEPAQEVGGDLYAYTIDDGHFFKFIVGDVSGKGISAALTMSRCETIFQDMVRYSDNPAELMTALNKRMCDNNKAGMFITATVGFLDLNTGKLVYSNAGHLSPLLVTEVDAPVVLDKPKGKPLGILSGAAYSNMEYTLDYGRYLVLITDGVTEAENVGRELFGSDRAQESVTGLSNICASMIDDAIVDSVSEYSNGADQSDDITIMSIGIRKTPFEYSINSDIKELTKVANEINKDMANTSADASVRDDIALVIEEYVSNIIKHSDKGKGTGKIRIGIWPKETNAIIQIEDDADAFNQFEADSPMLSVDPEKRQPGGMGIHMTKNRVVDYSYYGDDGGNLITMYLRSQKDKND